MNGFAFGPHIFGLFQTIAAIAIVIFQLFFYERMVKWVGLHKSFVYGLIWSIFLTLPFPAFGLVADPARFGFWRYVPVGAWQALRVSGFEAAFNTMPVLINQECSAHNRGSVNGWCGSLNALSRGVFTLVAGAMVTLGCRLETIE